MLAAAQAQKHVTLNEALSILDASVQPAVISRTRTTPPGSPTEGDRHLVASGASGDWLGADGRIALFVNGGWRFLPPREGWRLWVEEEGLTIAYASGAWGPPPIASGLGGHAFFEQFIFDEPIQPGGAFETVGQIPANTQAFGLTARVISEITGASGWDVGVVGNEKRYGGGHDVALNASVELARSSIDKYGSAQSLLITPVGGDFSGGMVRFAIPLLRFTPPDPV
ncbi:MAG: DUF2793 domain-containing protein [Pseudomonadota bacterium]